ncbi:MAG: CehA/McbA family metallohydrolase [Promethearchaeota archaeon]
MNPHKYPVEKYGAIFDCHVHTHYDLHDGLITPSQLIKLHQKRGFNIVLAMNHDTLNGLDKIKKLAAWAGLPTIIGLEVSTIYNHLLAYGVREWPYRRDSYNPEEMIERLREQDCAIFLSHPCNNPMHGHWTPDVVKRLDVDGIEWNNASNTILNRRTFKLFKDFPEGRRIAGTDAHTPATFGFAYTQVKVNSTNPDDVVAAMKSGKCRPGGQYVPLFNMLYEQLKLTVKNKLLKRFKINGKWIKPVGDMPRTIAPESFPPANSLTGGEMKDFTRPLARRWKKELLEKNPVLPYKF